MKYNKQPLDIYAQIALLKGRGLNIANEQAAEKTLGTLTKIFTNSSATKTKKAIAQDFDHTAFKAFESWLACMASLRNYCAHHARIWNRNYPVTPDLPTCLPQTWLTNTKVPFNKLYAQLCCIIYLLNRIDLQNTFTADIKALLARYPNVDPAAMGFVAGWDNEPLWQHQ